MLGTVGFIVAALTRRDHEPPRFPGAVDRATAKRAQSLRAMMAATGATAIGVNVVAAEQYLAIAPATSTRATSRSAASRRRASVPPDRRHGHRHLGAGLPWNSCGAYAAGVPVATVTCFAFNWINPLVSFLYDAMGWQIHRVPPEQIRRRTRPG